MAKQTVAQVSEKVDQLASVVQQLAEVMTAPQAQVQQAQATPAQETANKVQSLAGAVFIGHQVQRPDGTLVEDERSGYVFWPLAQGGVAYAPTRDGLSGLKPTVPDPNKPTGLKNRTGYTGGKAVNPAQVAELHRCLSDARLTGIMGGQS